MICSQKLFNSRESSVFVRAFELVDDFRMTG